MQMTSLLEKLDGVAQRKW